MSRLRLSRVNRGDCVALFDPAADAIVVMGVAGVQLTLELATGLAGRFGKAYLGP